MKKEEKLEILKDFLREEKIDFEEDCVRCGQLMSIFIPRFLICVRMSNVNDQKFYEKVKFVYHPLFIRDKETSEFIVEKMQNLIIDLMKRKQKKLMKKQAKK